VVRRSSACCVARVQLEVAHAHREARVIRRRRAAVHGVVAVPDTCREAHAGRGIAGANKGVIFGPRNLRLPAQTMVSPHVVQG
jgi:hypothetical protein